MSKVNFKDCSWIRIEADGKVKILRQELYTYLKENLHLKISGNGNMYLYDSGCYRLISNNELKALIKSICLCNFVTTKTGKLSGGNLLLIFQTSKKRILTVMKSILFSRTVS